MSQDIDDKNLDKIADLVLHYAKNPGIGITEIRILLTFILVCVRRLESETKNPQ